jgi:hypothetical protein
MTIRNGTTVEIRQREVAFNLPDLGVYVCSLLQLEHAMKLSRAILVRYAVEAHDRTAWPGRGYWQMQFSSLPKVSLAAIYASCRHS